MVMAYTIVIILDRLIKYIYNTLNINIIKLILE